MFWIAFRWLLNGLPRVSHSFNNGLLAVIGLSQTQNRFTWNPVSYSPYVSQPCPCHCHPSQPVPLAVPKLDSPPRPSHTHPQRALSQRHSLAVLPVATPVVAILHLKVGHFLWLSVPLDIPLGGQTTQSKSFHTTTTSSMQHHDEQCPLPATSKRHPPWPRHRGCASPSRGLLPLLSPHGPVCLWRGPQGSIVHLLPDCQCNVTFHLHFQGPCHAPFWPMWSNIIDFKGDQLSVFAFRDNSMKVKPPSEHTCTQHSEIENMRRQIS